MPKGVARKREQCTLCGFMIPRGYFVLRDGAVVCKSSNGRCPLRRPKTRRDLVPVAPLREAFERSELNAYQLARMLGWMREPDPRCSNGGPRPDSSRVLRSLGIKPHQAVAGSSRKIYRQRIDYGMAVKLTELMGLDPVDTGV